MENLYIQTPLLESVSLSKEMGIPVYLKMEALQPSGSYKDRGLGILLKDYVNRGLNSFITASRGHSGLSLAHAARVLNVKLKVVVPEKTSDFIKNKIKLMGAEVVVNGADFEGAEHEAKKIATKTKATYVNPHDDPLIFKGISSMIYEVFGAGLKPGAILLSVHSGDLLAGVIQGLQECKWADIPLITAEMETHCPFATALFAEEHQAKGIVPEAFLSLKKQKVYPHIISEKAAFDACVAFANEQCVLVEPKFSSELAPIYQNMPLLKTFSSILVIVSGGSDVNLATFQ